MGQLRMTIALWSPSRRGGFAYMCGVIRALCYNWIVLSVWTMQCWWLRYWWVRPPWGVQGMRATGGAAWAMPARHAWNSHPPRMQGWACGMAGLLHGCTAELDRIAAGCSHCPCWFCRAAGTQGLQVSQALSLCPAEVHMKLAHKFSSTGCARLGTPRSQCHTQPPLYKAAVDAPLTP